MLTFEEIGTLRSKIQDQLSQVIVGQENVIEELIIALFCQSHAILEGVPGLAKTLLISTLARTMNLSFNRIQFTPDLMPGDITGAEIIEEDRSTGRRDYRFIEGPLFANVVLADEINRTPPKTQAALLEAMQERQVTVGRVRHELPIPFFVLATQNPIEQEGTYSLPEAQQDRFMFKILVKYPSWKEEFEVVRRTTSTTQADIQPVLGAQEILEIQRLVREIPVSEHLIRYALSLVRQTRIGEEGVPEFIEENLSWGAGPRAVQNLILGAKARAMIHGRNHVNTDDVKSLAYPILRHRIALNFTAESEGMTPDQIIERLIQETPDREDELLNHPRFKRMFGI
ncbi:MAG: MoxR family ATPase [Thermoguttaceae bacterium]|nr:MoxR family ATPase [Thermoguttaceae bacterium]MDO4858836.1 MoxR family ATPase [Thermoguttaceae bacterium]